MTMEIFWQVTCGLVGVLAYYALRYMPSGHFNFAAYFGLELKQLIKGVIGFVVIFLGWEALSHIALFFPQMENFTVPPMSKAVAVLVGLFSKKAVDLFLRRFEKAA